MLTRFDHFVEINAIGCFTEKLAIQGNRFLQWEIPGLEENPTKGIRQFQENNKRERYLTPEEAKRLFQAIEASPNPLLTPIVGLLLLTQTRRQSLPGVATWVA